MFFSMALVACLSKILAATLLTVLLIPMLSSKYFIKRKIIVSFLSLIILLVTCSWYFLWVPYLNSYGFGDHFFMGLSLQEGINEILDKWVMVLQRLFITPLKYTGLITFLITLIFVVRKKKWLPLAVFLLPFVSYLILLVKTGASIVDDKYYVITIIPSIAFMVGYGLSQLSNTKLITFILIIVGAEATHQIYEFRIRQPFRSLETLELIMDSISQRKDLIAINANSPHNPTAMYFAHRRGWAAINEHLLDRNYQDYLKSKGCKFIVIAKKLYGDLTLEYPEVHNSEYFRIYSIAK